MINYIGKVHQSPELVDDWGDITTVPYTCLGPPDDVLCRDYADGDDYWLHSASIYYYGDTWTLNIVEPEGRPQILSIDDCTYEQSDPNIISWDVSDTNPSHYIIYDDGIQFDQGQWITGSITTNLSSRICLVKR